jgi:uncharacterized protein YhbP (UPF0306 family)
MSNEKAKQKILKFLSENHLATLSSLSGSGELHAAPIYCIVNDDLECFFMTSEKSQKMHNIQHRNEVLLTITNEERLITAQVRGVAKADEMPPPEYLQLLEKALIDEWKVVSTLPALAIKGEKRVVKISPQEIRLRSFGGGGMEEETMSFK